MRHPSILVTLAIAMIARIPALSQEGNNPFAGRWDMTVSTAKGAYPAWMEVVEKDGNLQVRIQGRVSSVRPAAAAKMAGSRLMVTLSGAFPARPASGKKAAAAARPEVTWELTVEGGQLTGSQKQGDAVDAQLAGVRAPALKHVAPGAWTDPERLFNGKDLTGWVTVNNTQHPTATTNRWVVEDGELVNDTPGHNLVTTRKFNDFKLHAEFNLTAAGNSGIYLRGRYEVQVQSAAGGPSARGGGLTDVGSVYGLIAPSVDIPAKPDQWQIFDITLIGRDVTIDLNGVRIIDNQRIPGITGGALDSNEGEPGPIYLQGEHSGGIRFRNITISVPKKG